LPTYLLQREKDDEEATRRAAMKQTRRPLLKVREKYFEISKSKQYQKVSELEKSTQGLEVS
jgi:hypothetical protein